jgi:hypothetical protein
MDAAYRPTRLWPVALTDPVDAHLLAALAEAGKMAVHELAARVGMDPRDVAYRLVGLSAQGLPLLVGVESDPAGLRAALASSRPHPSQHQVTGPPSGPYQAPGVPSGPHQVHGTPSGAYPVQGTPSGAYQVQGTPSGAYQVHGTPSGPHHVQGTPSGSYQVQGTPSGSYQVQGTPTGPHQAPGTPSGAFAVQGTPSGAFPPATQPASPHATGAHQAPPPIAPDPVMNTWGPPQSAQWARGDQLPISTTPKQGRPGDALDTVGLEGEQLAVQLLEVQDPADYLFSAAGYSLEENERAVVVHTEVTNTGSIPFASLPDNYLELLTADGEAIAKAPVSLTSRPPHKIGVQPGETSGGHTVYVVGESVRITGVRWSPRPEPDGRSLIWSLEE